MKYILISFFLFFYFGSSAQTDFKYDYIGALVISDTVLLSYELKFNIINNELLGYSFTDIGGADETKSEIKGKYNLKTNEIDFKESDILYTKSTYEEESFCFVNGVGNLKFKKSGSSMKGEFEGEMANGDICVNGTFELMSLKSIEEKVKKLQKKVKKSLILKKESKEKFAQVDILGDMQSSVLRANENLSVFCKSDIIEIEIWDNQIEDGDMISINYNGLSLLRAFKVRNKKKIVSVKLNKKINELEFIALNTGITGNNTSTINLIDNGKTTNITTSLNLDEKTKILLVRH